MNAIVAKQLLWSNEEKTLKLNRFLVKV